MLFIKSSSSCPARQQNFESLVPSCLPVVKCLLDDEQCAACLNGRISTGTRSGDVDKLNVTSVHSFKEEKQRGERRNAEALEDREPEILRLS